MFFNKANALIEPCKSGNKGVTGNRECGGVQSATDTVKLCEVGQFIADALSNIDQLSLHRYMYRQSYVNTIAQLIIISKGALAAECFPIQWTYTKGSEKRGILMSNTTVNNIPKTFRCN